MPDLDDTLGDTSLRDAFESFRAGSLDTVIPEGADAVRHTVRRRHRNRVAAVAVVAALVVLAGGASALAALNPVSNNQHTATNGSGTPTPSASTTPSVKPKPSGSESGGTAPDGQIGANELLNATLDVPAWGGQADDRCSSGRLTFHNGSIDLGNEYLLTMSNASAGAPLPPLYFEDVDSDGAKETIVTFWCGINGNGAYQAVALDRDTAGNIVTLGQIASNGQDTAGWAVISQITTTADGDVQLKWTRNPPGAAASTPQWRTYHWTGSGFEQVGGPTAFPTESQSPVQFSVSAPSEVGLAADNGHYSGTLTIQVTNTGTQSVNEFHLTFAVPNGAQINSVVSSSPNNWTCQLNGATAARCDFAGTLPPNGTVKTTANVQTTGASIPSQKSDANVYYTTDNPGGWDAWYTLVATS